MTRKKAQKMQPNDMISRNNSAKSGSVSRSPSPAPSKSVGRSKSAAGTSKKSKSNQLSIPVYSRSTDKKSLGEDLAMTTQSLPTVSQKHDRLMVGQSSESSRLSNAEMQDAFDEIYFSFSGTFNPFKKVASFLFETDTDDEDEEEDKDARKTNGSENEGQEDVNDAGETNEPENEVQVEADDAQTEAAEYESGEEDGGQADTQSTTQISPMLMVFSTVLVASVAIVQYGPDNFAQVQETVRELITEPEKDVNEEAEEERVNANDCDGKSSENPEKQGFIRWILSAPFPKYKCKHLKLKMNAVKESQAGDCDKS